MSNDKFPDWWSWKTVIEHAPRLGIPHFQRGHVWDQGGTVALLESMYEGSPCGSFVLWRPEGSRPAEEIGVPLVDGTVPDLWLVDGQQRTRTLLAVVADILAFELSSRAEGRGLLPDAAIQRFQNISSPASPEEEETGPDAPDAEAAVSDAEEPSKTLRTWFVWAPRIPEVVSRAGDKTLRDWAERKDIARYSWFRRFGEDSVYPAASEQRMVGSLPPPQPPPGLIPLGALLGADDDILTISDPGPVIERLKRLDEEDCRWLQEHLPWGPIFIQAKAEPWNTGLRERTAPLRALLGGAGSGALCGLANRLRAMFEGPRFAVGELPPGGMADAITAYVRINRAGVRVSAEERALAVLTRWHGDLVPSLNEFLRARDDLNRVHDSRSTLAHAADKAFGFDLWMRTVVRYTVLRTIAKTGIKWVGPDAVEKWAFMNAAEKMGLRSMKGVIEDAVRHAGAALLLLDTVLAESLSFDHRMARPDTRSLLPLIEVFARLTTEELGRLRNSPDHLGALARVLHWTMLHRYLDQEEVGQICEVIHGDRNTDGTWSCGVGDEFLSILLRRLTVSIDDIWKKEFRTKLIPIPQGDIEKRLRGFAARSFDLLVDEASSLQHPAVGWLYAIERRSNRAREFDWAQQVDAFARTGGKRGVKCPPKNGGAIALDAKCEPERQHVVPFAKAREIVGKRGPRGTVSSANNIGNLTWLSRRQNGLTDCGLSDRWAELTAEKDTDNLKARGFLAINASTGRSALDNYLALAVMGQQALTSDEADERYDEFTSLRREWMKDQMRTWLDEPLPEGSRRLLDLGTRLPRVDDTALPVIPHGPIDNQADLPDSACLEEELLGPV